MDVALSAPPVPADLQGSNSSSSTGCRISFAYFVRGSSTDRDATAELGLLDHPTRVTTHGVICLKSQHRRMATDIRLAGNSAVQERHQNACQYVLQWGKRACCAKPKGKLSEPEGAVV